MKTDLEILEEEMKKMNVDIVKDEEMADGQYLSVEVDIDCEVNVEFMRHLVMRKRVLRGSQYFVSFANHKVGTLTMCIGVKLPDDYLFSHAKSDLDQLGVIATTFPDLCWIHSNGTTSKNMHEVATAYRPDVRLGDLTWVLPSKFVDDFVEMMHTLNLSIISGLMQDAVVYGPIILDKSEF